MREEFRQSKSHPKTLQVGENDFEVATVFPKELAARSAG
jgi:hypothetical protein